MWQELLLNLFLFLVGNVTLKLCDCLLKKLSKRKQSKTLFFVCMSGIFDKSIWNTFRDLGLANDFTHPVLFVAYTI